jgi:hypothetical protein
MPGRWQYAHYVLPNMFVITTMRTPVSIVQLHFIPKRLATQQVMLLTTGGCCFTHVARMYCTCVRRGSNEAVLR